MAVSILGAAEIAYHAQSLPLFELFGVPPPVLFPRTHVVVRGPAERRLAEQLRIAGRGPAAAGRRRPRRPTCPQADALERACRRRPSGSSRRSRLRARGGSTPRSRARSRTRPKKIAYQFEQLADRARKAARAQGATSRRTAASVWARRSFRAPDGVPAERVYPPLSAMLAFGRDDVLDALRRVAGKRTRGRGRRGPGSRPVGGAAMPVDVLAIAAHPDDVELTCGGTLASLEGARLPLRDRGPDARRDGHARHAGDPRGGGPARRRDPRRRVPRGARPRRRRPAPGPRAGARRHRRHPAREAARWS